MAEPQPSTVQEGDTTTSIPASNNEDRKAAAAMDNLDTQEPSAESKKEVDQKALGDAMKRLDVGSKSASGSNAGASEAKKKADAKRAEEERIAEERRKVKVDVADVNLLTEQLDVSKARATDLLKAHDGDAVKAMSAWVTSSA